MLDLMAVHRQLNIKQRELETRLTLLHSDQRRASGPLPKDSEDRAQAMENDEVIDALTEEAEGELQQIRHAMVRIKQGEYSQCEVCGEEIDHDRLKAVPSTSVCFHCANQN